MAIFKNVRPFRDCFVLALFALALVLRSWSLVLVLTLGIFVFWRSRIDGKQKTKVKRPKLSKEESDAIIAAWIPEPLIPKYEDEEEKQKFMPRVLEEKLLKYVTIDGKRCLNLASNDFLALIGNQRIEEIAQRTVSKYGVGACGPRNFYGTVDVHLHLEQHLAQFLGCEEAILYSYGFATVASAIPAYSKPGDLLFVDRGVNFAIQQGLQASKSKIVWFDHNDTDHLEMLLKEQVELDKKNPKKAANIRRFIVVEGVYAKTASICPLPRLIELKWKYKVRLFVDESLSFGVLGQHGRGVTEHFGVDVIDVDLIAASLENALATVGGFCAGRSFVIGHQRLSGLGYCFSASLPPLLATAASEALRIIQEQPDMFERLRRISIQLHRMIEAAVEGTHFQLIGTAICPLKHIGHGHEDKGVAEKQLDLLVKEFHDVGIFITRARLLEEKEAFPTQPSAKIVCRVDLSPEEIEEVGRTLQLTIAKLEASAI